MLTFIIITFCAYTTYACDAPSISATAKGPNQINLTWSAVSNPCYGWLVEITSASDSRYSSFTEIIPWIAATGDATLLNTDPTCQYCYNPSNNIIPYQVTEAFNTDHQDDTPAQYILTGLKNNTSYDVRVRSHSLYPSPTYSPYSNTVTISTLNFPVRYVNTATGNDTNSGLDSTTNAWKTISKACSTLTSGQLGIVMGGNYTVDKCDTANAGSSGSANKIVLQENPGDTVIITTPVPSSNVFLIDQNYWIIDGIDSTADVGAGAIAVVWTGSRGGWFNSELNNRNRPGPQLRGHNNIVQRIWSHDVGVNTVDAGSAFYIISQADGEATNNVVQYSHLTRGAHDTGSELSNFSGGISPPHHNKWLYNIFDGGWGTGWQTINSSALHPVAHHGLFDGNIIRSAGRLVSNYKVGIQLSSDNVTIRRTIVLDSDDHAFEINSIRSSMRDSLIYNVTIIAADQRCFWISNNNFGPYTNLKIQNTICIKSGTEIDGGSGSVANLFITYSTDITWRFKFNNILYYNVGTPAPNTAVVDYNQGTLRTVNYADTNLNPPFANNDGLNVNPQFVNETNYSDLHLGSSSPMINTGEAIIDTNGWGNINQNDLGAYEFFNANSGSQRTLSGGHTLRGGNSSN